MPRAYDAQPLPIDRDPLRNILTGIPKQPPVDYAALQQAGINWFNTMFGDLIDTSAWDEAKAKWDNLMSQIGTLFTLVNSGPVSAAQWAVWWSNTLIALGYDSTSAATIANWLSGNYDAAKTAKANWDTFVTALGLNPTQIAAAIATATANWTSFMAAWGVGTPADVATATANAKAQLAAFLASIGLGSMTAAGAQLAGNNTSITNQAGYWQRLTEDLWIIYGDGLHVWYPLGTPSDTATTTSTAYGTPARRTWYSAQADLKLLQTSTGAPTPPTAVSGDVGTFAANTQTQVLTNESTLAQVQADVDALKTADNSVAGAKFLVSASGSSTTWGSPWTTAVTNGNISPKTTLDLFDLAVAASSSIDLKVTGQFTGGITLTDDQVISIVYQDPARSMFGGVGPTITLKGRKDTAGNNYVYARLGFGTVAIGYAVGGVEQTPWATATGVGIPAGSLVTLSLGSSAGPRNYQLKVGSTVVLTWAEVGTSSQLGASYRGAGMDMLVTHGISNDTWPPARVKQFKLQDSNVGSTTYGSSARWYRAATSWGSFTRGSVLSLGGLVYDTQEYASPDIKLVTNGFAIYTPGRYRLTHAAKVSNSNLGWNSVSTGTFYASANRITLPGPTVVSYASSKYDLNPTIGVGGSISFNAVGDGGTTELWAPSIAIGGSGTAYLGGDGAGEGTWVTIERID